MDNKIKRDIAIAMDWDTGELGFNRKKSIGGSIVCESYEKWDPETDPTCNQNIVKRIVRGHQLSMMGLMYNGSEFTMDDVNIHWTEITCDSEDEWNKKMLSITTEINKRKMMSATSDQVRGTESLSTKECQREIKES